jgi:sortase A
LLQEAYHYPWKQVVEAAEMPAPALPDMPYISYAEYVRSGRGGAMPAAGFDLVDSGDVAVVVSEESPLVLLGTVKIPRLDISENLLEGTYDQMHYGIGHLAGTPLPGAEGNAVIAAHRVSSSGMFPFRHLDMLEAGDTVTVELGDESFTYEVYNSFIVNQQEVWVLEPLEGETHTLTLVTCDPVVSATRRPNRLIVRARLVG